MVEHIYSQDELRRRDALGFAIQHAGMEATVDEVVQAAEKFEQFIRAGGRSSSPAS